MVLLEFNNKEIREVSQSGFDEERVRKLLFGCPHRKGMASTVEAFLRVLKGQNGVIMSRLFNDLQNVQKSLLFSQQFMKNQAHGPMHKFGTQVVLGPQYLIRMHQYALSIHEKHDDNSQQRELELRWKTPDKTEVLARSSKDIGPRNPARRG